MLPCLLKFELIPWGEVQDGFGRHYQRVARQVYSPSKHSVSCLLPDEYLSSNEHCHFNTYCPVAMEDFEALGV